MRMVSAGYCCCLVLAASTSGWPGCDGAVSPGGSEHCGNEVGNGNEVIPGPSGPSGADRDSVFRSLAVHPADANIIWMGTERNGFVKSKDGGMTWARHRVGLRHTNAGYPEIWDIAVSASNPDILMAATLDSPGPVTGDYPSAMAGVYKSTDGGETWARKNCGMDSSRITSVRFDPLDPNLAIAGVEGGEPSFSGIDDPYSEGGLYRSTDGGESWTAIGLDANDGRNGFWHMRVRNGNPSMFITFGMNHSDLSQNHGFLISRDSGATWSGFGAHLRTGMIWQFDVSTDGAVIYANETDTFVLHKSTNGGQTWATIFHPNANGPVAISPADSQIVLFAGTSVLYRSGDGLASNSVVLSASKQIHDVVFAPSDANMVYVATEGYQIYKSSDAGQTFTLIANIRADVLNASE